MYRYQFTSTIEDLLAAEEAERTARSVRAPFRWVIVVFGVGWLTIAILAFNINKPTWQPLIWAVIGGVILYFFVGKPYLKRSRIRQTNAVCQDLTLEFGDDCLKFHITGIGDFVRQWREFTSFVDTRKGILFYFTDGTVNWLPNRIFPDTAERNSFIEFLKNHENQGPGISETGYSND